MSIWDSMKKMAQPYDNDYDDYEDEADYGEETRSAVPAEAPTMDYSDSIATTPAPSFSGKVVTNLNRGRSEIKLIAPESFKDASVAAKHLCENRIVHLNVEHTEEVTARRVIDFLSGCVFALEGKVTKAGTDIYIFTPNNVEVSSEEQASDDAASEI